MSKLAFFKQFPPGRRISRSAIWRGKVQFEHTSVAAETIEEPLVHFYDLQQHGSLLQKLIPLSARPCNYRFGISMLPELARFRQLPPEAIIGWSNFNKVDQVHVDFWEQSAFVTFLHETLEKFVDAGGDSALQARAKSYQSGWMAIADERALAPLNRSPDPDDIVGMILVRDGHIVKGSYQLMPTHRLFTHIGEFQLPAGIRLFIMQELEKLIQLFQNHN